MKQLTIRQHLALVPAHKQGAYVIMIGNCRFTLFRNKNQQLKCHAKYEHFDRIVNLPIKRFLKDNNSILTRKDLYFEVKTRLDVKHVDAGVKNRFPNGKQRISSSYL